MRIHQVDSFTAEPFKGNPAGVCVVDAFPDPAVMSAIAMEMNLSETAFVEKRADGFGIRFFTPAQEVALCGHATLASAHVLRELGLAGGGGVMFHAPRDDLAAAYDGEWIRMLFPAYEVKAIPPPPAIAAAAGTIPVEVCASGNEWLVARAESEKDVLDAVPDFETIRKNGIADLIALTAPSGPAGRRRPGRGWGFGRPGGAGRGDGPPAPGFSEAAGRDPAPDPPEAGRRRPGGPAAPGKTAGA